MTETDKDHPLGRTHPAAATETSALKSPPDRGARADKAATDEPAPAPTSVQFTPEQLATPALSMVGFRQMYIIVGPYRGNVLTMPDAEAESAKDNHWAVEMETVAPPFDANNPAEHDHELTDEDRAYAVVSANEWAAAVNEPPLPPDPPADEPAIVGETADARREREKRNADRRADYDRRKADQERREAERARKPDRAMQMQPGAKPGGEYQTRTDQPRRR
jgi:hypothetical protein